jgi:hypothetical protein
VKLLSRVSRLRLLSRGIVVLPPERGEIPAEVQFEVAWNTVTNIADLGTARLRTWQGQQWEEQVVARLKLGSCRRPEPIDLGLRRGQCFTVERGQTPDERIDKRVEVVIRPVCGSPSHSARRYQHRNRRR